MLNQSYVQYCINAGAIYGCMYVHMCLCLYMHNFTPTWDI